jgi:hypothetical protein
MKIRVGQVFRVSHRPENCTPDSKQTCACYIELTAGKHSSAADVQKGIWAYKDVGEAGQLFRRIPAILLHSNPLKEGSEVAPWVDIIESDLGYAIYNGDNRKSSLRPFDTRGNALLSHVQSFYADPALRKFAPPVLLFTQREIDSNRKGYREFSGYGVPTHYMLVSQREKDSDRYFTNLMVELALFRLDLENEIFDWNWIDCRRNATLTADEVLNSAPSAWKLWVREGEAALEKCRRRVARHRVTSTREQMDYSEKDKALVSEVAAYFATCPHAFEGLASLIAERVIGRNCKRGWVTKRSVDGGVDFVCRLDLGASFSRVPVVVLGQAKCLSSLSSSVSGRDIARLVARLQRGWIGVFVTTGVFSRSVQEELYEDKYPVIMINGKRLATELRLLLEQEGVSIAELLKQEKNWYENNLQPLEASRILDDTIFGTRLVFDIKSVNGGMG